MVVFDIEKKNLGSIYAGGCNKEIYMDYNKPDFFNPVPDHTMFQRYNTRFLFAAFVADILYISVVKYY